MVVGFIGFGEANSSIAAGLHEEGIRDLICYDPMQEDSRFAEKLREKCERAQAEMLSSAAEVGARADVIFMAVPSNFSISAAEGVLPGIGAGTIFTDVSTATPTDKKYVAEEIEKTGAEFVDGAMMGTLLKDRHQVPMLLSGTAAERLKELMQPYHMKMSVVGKVPGVATGMKFIRSITAKGISCLLFESFQAAQRYGVENEVAASFLNSFGPEFQSIMDGYVSGAILHADRREHEMQNVVDFLKQDGLPFVMAEATREKLAWIREMHLKDRFKDGVPRNWHGVLSGWQLNEM